MLRRYDRSIRASLQQILQKIDVDYTLASVRYSQEIFDMSFSKAVGTLICELLTLYVD